MRYFGLMEIHTQKASDDYCWVLGLRNSHDKIFPAGIVVGAAVLVCDNLSFSGEIKFARKHGAAHPQVLATSSQTGFGIAELRAEIAAVAQP